MLVMLLLGCQPTQLSAACDLIESEEINGVLCDPITVCCETYVQREDIKHVCWYEIGGHEFYCDTDTDCYQATIYAVGVACMDEDTGD